jgi:hypothetical protein
MNEASSGLIDIIEPLAPTVADGNNAYWVAAIIALLLILAAALLLLWKYKLPAYRALRRMRKLRQQSLAGELTPHESVFMLALELRHGLGIKRLRAEEVPLRFKPQDRARWPGFMQQLDVLLYQSGAEVSADKLAALFVQTEKWLWRYAR